MTHDTIAKNNIDNKPSHARRVRAVDIRCTPTNARAPVLFKTRAGRRTEAEKTFWPRLGGIRDDELRGLDFGGDVFRERYRPGIDVTGYVAGCLMLRHSAARYHLPLAKAG